MERPTILLAVGDDGRRVRRGAATRRLRAGQRRPAAGSTAVPAVDMGVIDCDLPAEVGHGRLPHLHAGKRDRRPCCWSVRARELPDGVGNPGDEVALKPLPAEALVYRLQALLIRTGRHLPIRVGWLGLGRERSAPRRSPARATSSASSLPRAASARRPIAVNMAVALRLQTRSEVLIFDADVGVGNVTAVLDVPYRMGLADLADSPPRGMDRCRLRAGRRDPCRERRAGHDLGDRSGRVGARHRRPAAGRAALGARSPLLRHRRQPPRLRRPHHGHAGRRERDLPGRHARGRCAAQQRAVPRARPRARAGPASCGSSSTARTTASVSRTWRTALGLPISATVSATARRPSSPRTRAAGGHEVPAREDLRRPARRGAPRLAARRRRSRAEPASVRRWWTRFGARTSQA